MRNGLLLLLAIAVVGVSAACSSSSTAGSEVADRSDLALSSSTEAVGAAAALTGQINRVDGCTYLTAADGQRWLPVFPADSAWVDGALVFGGTTHALDESVTLTGGEASSQYLQGLSGVPSGCDRSLPGWVVVA